MLSKKSAMQKTPSPPLPAALLSHALLLAAEAIRRHRCCGGFRGEPNGTAEPADEAPPGDSNGTVVDLPSSDPARSAPVVASFAFCSGVSKRT